MSTIETILLTVLVLDAIALTVLVLLQQGKGADVGAAFGSGSANTMFGSAGGASFLTKATAWLAIGFFAIAFGLAYIGNEKAGTVSNLGIPQVQIPAQTPATPAGDIPAQAAPVDEGGAPEDSAPDDIPDL